MECQLPYGDESVDKSENEKMIMASISDFSYVLSQLIDIELDNHYTKISSKEIEAIRLCACYTRSNINQLLRHQ